MIQKFSRTAYAIILGVFLIGITASACNNKGKKKDNKMDTMNNRPTAPGDKTTPQ